MGINMNANASSFLTLVSAVLLAAFITAPGKLCCGGKRAEIERDEFEARRMTR